MNKKQVITKDDLELYYSKCRKIRFEDDYKPKDIKEILDYTLYIDYSSKSTFFKRGKIHCYSCKFRSLDDIIKLCKFYFPNIEIKDVITGIIEYEKLISKNNSGKTLNFSNCPDIRKYNFRGTQYYGRSFFERINNGYLIFKDQGFPNCYINFKEFL